MATMLPPRGPCSRAGTDFMMALPHVILRMIVLHIVVLLRQLPQVWSQVSLQVRIAFELRRVLQSAMTVMT